MPEINGQFIDESQLGNQDAMMQAQSGGMPSSTAGDPNAKLKTVFAALMAANPKQYTALNAIYEKMAKPEESADERKKRTAKEEAQRIISQLEDFYLSNKLYYGNNSKGIWKEMISGSSLLSDQNDPAYRYKALLNSDRPFLVAAAGDVGNKGWQEQLQAGKPFPTLRVNKNTAEENFSEMRKKFGLPNRDYSKITGSTSSAGVSGGGMTDVNNLGVKSLGVQFGGN